MGINSMGSGYPPGYMESLDRAREHEDAVLHEDHSAQEQQGSHSMDTRGETTADRIDVARIRYEARKYFGL